MPPILNPLPWLDALAHGDDDARKKATMAIGSFPPETPIDVSPFIAALTSTREELVLWSVVGLGRAQSRAVSAVSALISLTQRHPAFGIRQAAICALREIAPGDPDSRSATFDALQDSNAFVRREALQSIAALPSLDPSELQKVRILATDPNDAVARWCDIALRQHEAR